MSYLPTSQMLFINSNTYQGDSDLNNYIRTVAWTYSQIWAAGNCTPSERYACGRMATHYDVLLNKLNS